MIFNKIISLYIMVLLDKIRILIVTIIMKNNSLIKDNSFSSDMLSNIIISPYI